MIETIYPDDTPDDLSDNPRSKSEYNNAGQRINQIDAQGHATRFVYDNLGRLVATHFADGTNTETIYDALGRRVAAIDQAGNKTEYEYDALGRLTDVVQFLNGEEIRTEYGYDESGRLIWQEDGNNHRTNYEYDNLGRRIAVELPETQRSTTEYDTVGNTFSVTDFNGDTITYSYDAQNRLVEKRVGETSIASFSYTPTGQLETVTDNRGVTSYSYDELGRLLSRTDPDGQYLASGASIEYGYDAAGNRTSVTTPTGTVEYAFDSQNRLKTVTDDAGVTSYSYDLNGNLIRTELPNGVMETRTYDELSRLESVSYVKDGTLIASYDYTLDPVGHRRVVEERDGRQVEYEYDDLYRLTRETIADPVNGNRTIEYTYDAVGNRLSRIDSVEGTTTYVYDENDLLVREELTTDGNVVHAISYRYDDNGNTIERIEKDGSNNVIGNATYSWDKENRLVGVTTSTGDVVSYEYDTDNIRVSSTVNGVTTEYLVDKNRPYAEVLSEYVDDAVAVNYLHGLDLISQERDGSESFYLADGLGSTRMLTDEGGEVANTYSYDAFGNLVASSGSIENEFLFAGEQYDENLEQYYLRQRYYDAWIGRFTRRDTYEGRIFEPITLHKYLYANGNPVNFTDPSGLLARRHFTQQFGEAAHEEISLLYAFEFLGDDLYFGDPYKGVGIGENPDLRTDIVNHTRKTYMEIKPFTPTGYTKGKQKMNRNKASFSGIGYLPDGTWKAPPIVGTTVVMGRRILFFNDFTGIIFYTDDINIHKTLLSFATLSEREKKATLRQLREGSLVVAGSILGAYATPSISNYIIQATTQLVAQLNLTQGLTKGLI